MCSTTTPRSQGKSGSQRMSNRMGHTWLGKVMNCFAYENWYVYVYIHAFFLFNDLISGYPFCLMCRINFDTCFFVLMGLE